MTRRSILFSLLLILIEAALPIRGQDSSLNTWRSSLAPEAFAQAGPAPAALKPAGIPIHSIKVLNSYPHDPEAFTQGLVILDGVLYESTGLNGRSSLRQVELETGKVLKKYDLSAQYFGEGLTDWKGSLVQLTWKSGKGFVYDRDSFKVRFEFGYSGEGWGITRDEKNLILSNGSNRLVFLNPETFERERLLSINAEGKPVRLLNELEYVKGEILANIWLKDFVARISPATGEVTAWIDMSELRNHMPAGMRAEALNGIAYDAEKDRLFVTGKLWPKLFQIEIVPEQPSQ